MSVREFLSRLHEGVDTYRHHSLALDGSAVVLTVTAPHSDFLGPRFRPHDLGGGRYGITLYQAVTILQDFGRRHRGMLRPPSRRGRPRRG